MLIIYDFDGTLTPYGQPQYEVIRRCGYDEESMTRLVEKTMANNNMTAYEAFYASYREIFKRGNMDFTLDNILLGVSDVEFNEGIFDYFNAFKFSDTGIKHYMVTSGFVDYVRKTKVAEFFDGIYGTTFCYGEDGELKIAKILTDREKVNTIKKIAEENNASGEEIVYFGDGITDRDAFEYVHENGGKSIFVGNDFADNKIYKLLKDRDIIDACFKYDYSPGGKIFNFIKEQCGLKTENV